MNRNALLLAVALAGCGATYHEVSLVNRSPRPITEVYIYQTGSANHGASRGTLAPEASMKVKVKAGNVDVLAVSAKLKVNDKESETRTATQTLELKRPVLLVFHDSSQTIPGLDQPGTIGVSFLVTPEPETAEPLTPPAP